MVGKTFTHKPKRYKTAAQKVVKTIYIYIYAFLYILKSNNFLIPYSCVSSCSMFITITLFVKFLGSRRGHFGNGHLPGYSGRFPEVPTADHGESRGSHQTGGETGQGGVSGGAGKR